MGLAGSTRFELLNYGLVSSGFFSLSLSLSPNGLGSEEIRMNYTDAG